MNLDEAFFLKLHNQTGAFDTREREANHIFLRKFEGDFPPLTTTQPSRKLSAAIDGVLQL